MRPMWPEGALALCSNASSCRGEASDVQGSPSLELLPDRAVLGVSSRDCLACGPNGLPPAAVLVVDVLVSVAGPHRPAELGAELLAVDDLAQVPAVPVDQPDPDRSSGVVNARGRCTSTQASPQPYTPAALPSIQVEKCAQGRLAGAGAHTPTADQLASADSHYPGRPRSSWSSNSPSRTGARAAATSSQTWPCPGVDNAGCRHRRRRSTACTNR